MKEIPSKTEISRDYTPNDFFEAEVIHNEPDFDVIIGNGKAIIRLRVPTDPIDVGLAERLSAYIETAFRARSVQIHKSFKLGPAVCSQEYSGGRRVNQASISGTARIVLGGERADFILRDKDGKVIRDTRQERIDEESRFLNLVLSKIHSSSAMQGIFEGYHMAVEDPENELVHLYEIRDLIGKELGGEKTGCTLLGLSRSSWSRFGLICNDLPLRQGRHRGKNVGSLRDATSTELEEARKIAKEMIEAFMNYLP